MLLEMKVDNSEWNSVKPEYALDVASIFGNRNATEFFEDLIEHKASHLTDWVEVD